VQILKFGSVKITPSDLDYFEDVGSDLGIVCISTMIQEYRFALEAAEQKFDEHNREWDPIIDRQKWLLTLTPDDVISGQASIPGVKGAWEAEDMKEFVWTMLSVVQARPSQAPVMAHLLASICNSNHPASAFLRQFVTRVVLFGAERDNTRGRLAFELLGTGVIDCLVLNRLMVVPPPQPSGAQRVIQFADWVSPFLSKEKAPSPGDWELQDANWRTSCENPDKLASAIRADDVDCFQYLLLRDPTHFNTNLNLELPAFELDNPTPERVLIYACRYDALNCVKFLVQNGATVTGEVWVGAIHGGGHEVIRIIEERVPAMNANQDFAFQLFPKGEEAFLVSLRSLRFRVFNWLVENKYAHTLYLHLPSIVSAAAKAGHLAALAFLMKHGLALALQEDQHLLTNVCQCLFDCGFGAAVTALLPFVDRENDISAFTAILPFFDRENDISAFKRRGGFIARAAGTGSVRMLELLLLGTVSPRNQPGIRDGLAAAAAAGHIDALGFLIQRFDWDAGLSDGGLWDGSLWKVLAAACKAKQVEMVKILLRVMAGPPRTFGRPLSAENALINDTSKVLSEAILHGETASALFFVENGVPWSAVEVAPAMLRTSSQATVRAVIGQLEPDRRAELAHAVLSLGPSCDGVSPAFSPVRIDLETLKLLFESSEFCDEFVRNAIRLSRGRFDVLEELVGVFKLRVHPTILTAALVKGFCFVAGHSRPAYIEAAKFLLNYGCCWASQDECPLVIAALAGVDGVLKLILKMEAESLPDHLPEVHAAIRAMIQNRHMSHRMTPFPLLQILVGVRGVDVNILDSPEPLITFAARTGSERLVHLLLKHSELNVNRVYESGTALMHAITNPTSTIARIFIACDRVDVNFANALGETALLLAISRDVTTTVKLLVDCKRFDLWAKGPDGSTQLETAVRWGSVVLVRAILSFIGDTSDHLKDVNEAFRPVLFPEWNSWRGSNVNRSDPPGFGLTARYLPTTRSLLELILIFRNIKGVDDSRVIDVMNSLLICATRDGDYDLLQSVLENREVDVNFITPGGESAFSIAVRGGMTPLVDLIQDCERFCPWVVNANGMSQIALAAAQGSPMVVKALIDARRTQVSDHIPEITHAMRVLLTLWRPRPLATFVEKDTAVFDVIPQTLSTEYAPCLEALVLTLLELKESAGGLFNFDFNVMGNHNSLIIFAAATGTVELVTRLLLIQDLNVNFSNAEGTALMHAIDAHQDKTADLLIQCERVDLDVITGSGKTVLSVAVQANAIHMIEKLIAAKTRFHANRQKWTSLVLAALLQKQVELAKILLTIPVVDPSDFELPLITGISCRMIVAAMECGDPVLFSAVLEHVLFYAPPENLIGALAVATHKNAPEFLSVLLGVLDLDVNIAIGPISLLRVAASAKDPSNAVISFIVNDLKFQPVKSDLFEAWWDLVAAGKWEIVAQIGGVDMNGCFHNGQTPLTRATGQGNGHVIFQWLLKFDEVDVNLADNHGVTPLVACLHTIHTRAADYGSRRAAELLGNGDGLECLRQLLSRKDLNVNQACGQSGDTPMMMLASENNPDQQVFAMLLETGKINLRATNAKGDMAVVIAERNGHEWMIGSLRLPGFHENVPSDQ
jgi:ankyrin repeat protein